MAILPIFNEIYNGMYFFVRSEVQMMHQDYIHKYAPAATCMCAIAGK